MCNFRKRVILIHELWQLWTSEKFLNSCSNRLNVNKCLRRCSLKILGSHSLSYNSFHSWKTDSVLVLQKFANSPDTSVSEMIDIIFVTNTVFKVNIVVNGCNYIINCYVLRDEVAHILLKCRLDEISRRCDNLTCCGIHNIISKSVSGKSVFKMKLLIKLITSNLSKIISSRVKKHSINKALRAVNWERFARSYLLIQFKKALLVTSFRILLINWWILGNTCENLRLFSKQLKNLWVLTKSKCSDKDSNRNFPCSVYTNWENIVGVRLILQPCTSVRDNGAWI